MLCKFCTGLELDNTSVILELNIPGYYKHFDLWAWDASRNCDFCPFIRFLKETLHSTRLSDSSSIESSLALWSFPHIPGPGEAPGLPSYFEATADRFYSRGDLLWDDYAVKFAATNEPKNELLPDSYPTFCRVTSYIDFSGIKNLLRACVATHNWCMLDDIGHGRALSGLHVVDCFNRCVIPAPVDVKYVALSYLWGTNKSSHPRESDGKLPADVPSTIQDAITVTLNLGLQYLWVDAYCILQTDHDDVHRQIRQMDLIYRSAQVTIIAVESSTGLPGVSRPRRQWQFEGNYNTTRFQTFLLGPKKPIQSSRWWSRGWTFQEGFFSRRRLFFMEDQLILDCHQKCTIESLSHTPLMTGSLGLEVPQWSFQSSDISVYRLIEMYSGRDFTISGDVLLAFEGISQTLKAYQHGFGFYWGLPLFLNDSESLQSLLAGMSWFKSIYRGPQTRRRREGFPSWSWAGWMDTIAFTLFDIGAMDVGPELVCHVEYTNAKRTPWMEFESLLLSQKEDLELPPKVILSAHSVQVVLSGSSNGTVSIVGFVGANFAVAKHWGKDVTLDCNFEDLQRADGERYPNARTCFAIHLFFYEWDDMANHVLLLVSESTEGWERAGLWNSGRWLWKDKEMGRISKVGVWHWLQTSLVFQIREFCIV